MATSLFSFFSASLFLRLILTLILCITSLLVSVLPTPPPNIASLHFPPLFHLTLLPLPSICVFGSMKPWSLNDGLVHSGWANPVCSALSLGPFTVPHHQHNLLLLLIPLAQSRHTPHTYTHRDAHWLFLYRFSSIYNWTLHTDEESHREGQDILLDLLLPANSEFSSLWIKHAPVTPLAVRHDKAVMWQGVYNVLKSVPLFGVLITLNTRC